MARIRGKNTKPELIVRKVLYRLGYRYRLHRGDLPGRPDIVFVSRKIVLFVHGCFWHAHASCKLSNLPKSRREYWTAKFTRNKQRDELAATLLSQEGWRVMTVWECETKDTQSLERRLVCELTQPNAALERMGGHGRK